MLPLIWAATATAVLATCYAFANINVYIFPLFISCLVLLWGISSKVEVGWGLLSALRAIGIVMGVSQGIFGCQGAWPGALHYKWCIGRVSLLFCQGEWELG